MTWPPRPVRTMSNAARRAPVHPPDDPRSRRLPEPSRRARPGALPVIHRLFEAQAARTPEAVAVAFGGQLLSYRALDGRAERQARHLRTLGVGPETLVGICLDRSPGLVVGLLAILKAGAAYLPLDPAYPPDRLAF